MNGRVQSRKSRKRLVVFSVLAGVLIREALNPTFAILCGTVLSNKQVLLMVVCWIAGLICLFLALNEV